MDFHSLVRKELQALCKLNKIPANRTNVAMAEALASLQNVKGIEKFCKSAESSVAESSVESPEKDVVTSPKTNRTGRRKQVRDTPVAPRKNRFPVATVKSVQTVYNTRLSARLSKKELMEMEKKKCVEAVKISSYCDVVPDNDFGEVSEDKSVPVSDNVQVNSSVPQIEQQSESVKWKSADKDLDLKDTAVTNMKSKELENNEDVLEISRHDNIAVVDLPLHQKKDCLARLDDVGVTLFLSETDIVTANEVLQVNTEKAVVDSPTNERNAIIPILSMQEKGFADVGFSFSENEIPSEYLKRGDGENLDAQVTASTVSLNSKMDSFLSGIDNTTEVLTNEGSDNVQVDSLVPQIEQQSESVKWRSADKDLDLKDTGVTNMKSKALESNVEGFQINTVEAVLEKPRHKNMTVVDLPLHHQKDCLASTDDVGVTLCLSETDIVTNVPANEVEEFQVNTEKAVVDSPTNERNAIIQILSPQEKGSVDGGFSFSENEIQSEYLKMRDGENMDVQVTASTVALNSKIDGFQLVPQKPIGEMLSLGNEAVVDMPHHKMKDDVVDLSLPEIHMKIEVLAHEESDDIGVHFSFLEGSDNVGVHFSSETDENVDAAVTCSTDSRDDVGVDFCLSETDNITEVVANEVKVFEMDADKFEMPTSRRKAAIPILSPQEKGSVEVGFSYLENGVQSGTSKSGNGENLDAQVTALTDMKTVDLNGKGRLIDCLAWSDDIVADSSLSGIGETAVPTKEGSEDVGVHFSFSEADENVDADAAVTRSTDCKESDSLKEQLRMESGEKVDFGEQVHDLMIEPKSEIIVLSWSSAAKNFSDGENLDISVKVQQDISCNTESGAVYDNEKGLVSEKDFCGKVIASDPNIYSESYERPENSVHNSSGDTSAAADFCQHNAYSKQSDGKRKSLSGILSINGAVVIADGENFDVSMKIQQDISYNTESGAVYDNEKGLVSEEDLCGKIMASTPNIYSECYERTENSVHNSSGDDTSAPVSEILSGSGAVEFADGEDLDISVKILPDMNCNTESGAAYDNEKGLTSQEEASGKSIASGPRIYSESCERIEYSIHHSSDDDFSADADFIQHNDYSKESDSTRISVSEILSCNGTVEFSDDSVETTNDFSGGLTFVNVSGDEDRLADDPESRLETFNNKSWDTESEFDFLKYVICGQQQERKRDSITSQILGIRSPKEPAAQPENISSHTPTSKLMSNDSDDKENTGLAREKNEVMLHARSPTKMSR